MRTPREVTHEIRPLTDAERARYAGRLCLTWCPEPIAVVCIYRYTSSGGRGQTNVLHPRCATHGARWAYQHRLAAPGEAAR